MRKWNLVLSGIAILITIFVITQSKGIRAAPPAPTPISVSTADQNGLQAALDEAALSGQKTVPAFLLYKVIVDHIDMGPDGNTALVWMALLDPQTNQTVATEPGMAIGKRTDANSPWQITLPTGQDWVTQVENLPDLLMSKEQKTLVLPDQLDPKDAAAVNQVYTGYLLPWEGGKRVWLTGSVAHFTTYNSCSWVNVNGDYHSTCRYAFDFSDGTMFRILASRGGTVVGARWTCTNSDHNCLNYIALEDRTTSPVTTALYLHLAQNSIPSALRVNGTYVNAGDFIGLADNTGLSTGHHLHFMVVGNRWLATGYGGTFWWGDSVDITFDEVSINGGRPRLCSEAYYTPQYGSQCQPKNTAIGEPYDNWFVSGNRGTTPPTATLSSPAAYTEVTSPAVTVSGSAKDNTGVSRIQVIANYNNNWVEIGAPVTSNPFTTTVDLCAAGIPNGPVTLGLWAWDVEGSRSPLPQSPRPISKNSTCPAPAPKCSPTANQVALYSLPDYQGTCQVFGAGKYNNSQFSPLVDNQAASIQVGANVMGVLYDGIYDTSGFQGRSEAFLSNDPGLADNRIGAQMASSLEVKARSKPVAPILRLVLNRVDASGVAISPDSNESVLLTWKSEYATTSTDEGGTEYRAELILPGGAKRTSEWQTANTWSVGRLAAGSYQWTVTARNFLGESTASPAAFTITSAAALGGTVRQAPFSDDVEGGVNEWIADGLWHQAVPPKMTNNNVTVAWGFTNGIDYASGVVAGGGLTSPPVNIPAGGAQLKFRYASKTETNGPYWDQRRVQISADGGAFQDVLQLVDDPLNEWQSSPIIDLTPYAGKTVRVRFYFHIVDKFYNGTFGWWIDDISIAATGGDTSCVEAVSNDSPAGATPISLVQTINNVICPAGDVDYYRFHASSGTTISADVVAKADGSSLDPYLYLLDGDGKSPLAENDDIQYGVIQDSHLQYTIQRTGDYYLKVKAYNNPGVGGTNYFYRIALNGDNQPPVLTVTYPKNSWVPGSAFELQASALDLQGIARIDFYWHNPDWQFGTWDLLGSDTTSADGWKAAFDPAGRSVPGSAFAVRAYDNAGLGSAFVFWNLQIDTYPPASSMQALPATNQSTAIELNWSGSDAEAGLRSYELQVRDNGGAWTTINSALPAQQTQTYYLGTAGHSYGFRLRALDMAGNLEAFPAGNDAGTSIASTCNPDVFDNTQPGDNTASSAVLLAAGARQEHNFCPDGDQDWARFSAQSGKAYAVRAISLSGGAAASIAVTDASGQTIYAQTATSSFGQTTILKFVPPADGEYRIRVQALDAGLWGTNARYALSAAPSTWHYLPRVETVK